MPNRISGCVREDPTLNSVYLGGKWINQAAIARTQGLDPAHLNKILSGKRGCRYSTYLKIAAAIGISTDELVQAIAERVEAVAKQEITIVQDYKNRVKDEDRKNAIRMKKGKAPIPALPTFRLPEDRK